MPPLSQNQRIRYADLVDIAGLQALMDGFQQVLGIANAILDRDGTVLTQSGWQDLCQHFHRRHPQTLQRCVESDTSLAHSLLEGKPYAVYRCLNGLVDAAMPIVVAGEHVANAFAGQFFSAPPDREFFRRQAREFGFDEADYLAAVAKVPIVPPERIEPITRLFAHVAEFLGEQALQRLRLREAADEISDRKRSEASLRRHQALLEMIARGVPLPNILQAIAIHAETERPGLRCSILLLEPDGKHLRIGAAPSLPDFFNEAIEGMAIGPTKGSCGAAAYNGSRIITTNIASHPNWRHYRAVAEQAGLASCWSEPVRSSNGQLLGSLAFYTATPAEPNELDLAMIEYTANLAGIAIEHHKTREELERQAQLDYLTGLANRRHFLALAEMALAGAVRYGRALSVLMLDIDHFKAINDSQGHAVGDLVLQKLGEICRLNLRKMDLIGRWGGEEFAVLLPETDGQAAFEGSERLRQALAAGELALPSGRVLQFTVSIGLATLATDEASVETLIERADQALYMAKREGRNRVCWAATATDFHCVPEPSTTAAGSARESNVARYARAIDTSMDGYLLADARGRLLDANEALCQLTGYTRAQLLDMSVAQLSEDNGGQSVLSRLARIAPLGKARFDSRWRRRDGEWIAVEISATHVAEEGGLYFVFVRDVTPIQLAQQRLRHVTQLYAFLSHANAAIVHNPNPAVLLPELCRIAVEDGGFGLVWVGWRNPANDEVEPIATFGPASHYLQNIRLSASAAVPQGRGPTGIAIREGRPVIVNDFLADPLTTLWRDIAREHGLRASATYPLRQGPAIVGAIMFYAGEAGYFDEERADLLANLANDISFALTQAEAERQRLATDHALHAQTEALNRFFEVTPDLLCVADMDGFFRRVNRAWEHVLGYRKEALENQLFLDFVHADDLHATREAMAKLARGENITRFVNRYRRQDGSYRTFEWQAVAAGQLIFAAARDITERLLSEARLQLAGKVFEAARDSILVTDAEKRLLAANPAFTAMNGYSEAEVLRQNPRFLKSGLQTEAFYAGIWQAIARNGYWHGELWNRRKNGELYLALSTISEVRDAAGQLTHYVAIETDMSALKKAEQRIDYLAYYDPLTDLPNRALLAQRAELALALAGRHQEPLAVLFLDLDRFKAVNDSLGHEAGDALLLQVAQRLRDIVRETDTICRLGGDEFALLLPGDGHSGALAASRKILEILQEPVTVAQHELTASAALGIAVYPQDGQSFGELMKNAEAAMYQAKQQGRNAMAFYDPAMNQSALNRLLLEESLRKAIQTGQLRTHYQAKVRLDDGRLVGAEALVRWQHPEHGLIPPAQFIPLAESSGLIEAIGDWVLNDVIQQLAHWREQGLPPLPVAVNLAARHFRNTQLPDQLNALLARHGLSADVLELELTESILLDADATVLQTLGELRDLGIGLAIDDFGTGYSSLSYLRRFPITTIKIDQSFVRDLEEDPEDRTLALSIIALGHSLGLTVVAEGVETQAQRDILLQQGCDMAQGYWFSRPLPAEDFATWRQSAP
jgi:diguanylate cyclase (GGDEF)-like protein/PAS domain S-box-containing protein